jgi:S-DNA-T family DNA segregation ATPase FtsK/SpoIIIE
LKNCFKIVISGYRFNREYSLSKFESDIIKIGTTKNCQIRLNKDLFFEDFEINLVKTSSNWSIKSDDVVYFTEDNIMKLYSKDLKHDDHITVKFSNFNVEVFKISFFIDFDNVINSYNRVIDLSNINTITIGGTESCDIVINDSYMENSKLILSNENGYYLKFKNAKYGVYLNGEKITKFVKLKNLDFFSIIGHSFYIRKNSLYFSKSNQINIRSVKYFDIVEQKSSLNYPKFNRNTRIKHIIPEEEIEILPPKDKGKEPKQNLLLRLLPIFATIILTIVIRGIMNGGSSFVIFSVFTMSIGAITSIVTSINDKKNYKKELEDRKIKYLEYVERKKEDIKELRKKEYDILHEVYKPLEKNIDIVADFKKELFEKDLKDEDFLVVRVGKGVMDSRCKIKYPKKEFKDASDELMSIPEDIEKEFKKIKDVPVVSNFREANAIGVIGNELLCYEMLKIISFDIISRHFYKDVKLFYMFDENQKDKFTWTRWLRHVKNDEMNVRNLIFDEESKNALLEYIYITFMNRDLKVKKNEYDTYYIIFVFDSKEIGKHPISKYIENASEYGFTFVFFENEEEFLPKGCNEIIKLHDQNSGELIKSENGSERQKFGYTLINDRKINQLSLKLGSIYVDEVSLESELTKNISLFELLDIITINDLDITQRWNESIVYKSMAAPLGVKTKGKKVYLDLNEKHHGPHGLVAGTTGSGKSEILQSYILSMATIFHPYEVGFVIIDFKGGGMVNQFNDLPHLIGAITNIDGREINRSLKSIKAELLKRQELFSEYGEVVSTKVIIDQMSGRSKGFGFIEMENDEDALSAIAGLNGKEVNGRELKVNEAIDRPKKSFRY